MSCRRRDGDRVEMRKPDRRRSLSRLRAGAKLLPTAEELGDLFRLQLLRVLDELISETASFVSSIYTPSTLDTPASKLRCRLPCVP